MVVAIILLNNFGISHKIVLQLFITHVHDNKDGSYKMGPRKSAHTASHEVCNLIVCHLIVATIRQLLYKAHFNTFFRAHNEILRLTR